MPSIVFDGLVVGAPLVPFDHQLAMHGTIISGCYRIDYSREQLRIITSVHRDLEKGGQGIWMVQNTVKIRCLWHLLLMVTGRNVKNFKNRFSGAKSNKIKKKRFFESHQNETK